MQKKYIVAIDGPSASGKSTTARLLAKRLRYVYIDTGAMYRACALDSLLKGVGLQDADALADMLSKISISIQYSDNGNIILLNGADVSSRIREPDISKLSSEIAVIGQVRDRMVALQRVMGQAGGVIMDGRDIGTVVFPQAEFKFFMVADVSIRALRRWEELRARGTNKTLPEVEQELIWRDKNDSEREHSPLRQAQDAIVIDTTELNIEQQVNLLYDKIFSGSSHRSL